MKAKGKISILCVICGILGILSLFTALHEENQEKDLIRFHVIANSDSVFDQSVKLAVRNEIIEEVNRYLTEAKNAKEAESILKDRSAAITEAANKVLARHHCGYEAKTVLGTSAFPTKTYGEITLPAGEYNALRVVLGEGKGKNWWCVLYPPLCFVDIKDDTAVAVTTTEQFREKDGEVFAVDGNLFQIKIKSKLLELFR